MLLTFILAAALALIHLFAGKLRFLNVIPRSRWLSFASGLSVAYVFLHLLPEIAAGQGVLEEARLDLGIEDSHIWLIALSGLVIFYGLERLAKTSRQEQSPETPEDRTESGVFWLHVLSYSLYNVIIGYLLVHGESETLQDLLLFWFAMALHFFVNDYGMRQNHQEQYHRSGRWILAVAVLAGYTLSVMLELNESIIVILIGFLGGGVLLNVLKEELPEERRSAFIPFVAGAAAYSALLLVA